MGRLQPIGKLMVRAFVEKNAVSRCVQIAKKAAAAMQALRVFVAETGKGVTHSWLDAKWRNIRADAGFTDFMYHDNRHTCASFLTQSGARLQKIGSVRGRAQLDEKLGELGRSAPAPAGPPTRSEPPAEQNRAVCRSIFDV